MALSRALAVCCIAPAAACFIFAGCAARVASTTQPRDDSQLAVSVPSRVREIQTRVIGLDTTSQQMPGANDQSHRQLVGQYFADLTRVLPLIEGEYQSGEFRQGMRVLNSSREQLTAGSPDLASEPTIGQGLRAAERLLRNLNSFIFDNDAGITKNLDALQARINSLDTAHGAVNRVLSAQAIRTATEILQQMSTALAERSRVDAPTTNPATKPEAAPAAAAQ